MLTLSLSLDLDGGAPHRTVMSFCLGPAIGLCVRNYSFAELGLLEYQAIHRSSIFTVLCERYGFL